MFEPTIFPDLSVLSGWIFCWCFRFYKSSHCNLASSQFNSSLSRLNSLNFRLSGDKLLGHLCIIFFTARWGKWFISGTMYICTVRSQAEFYYLLWQWDMGHGAAFPCKTHSKWDMVPCFCAWNLRQYHFLNMFMSTARVVFKAVFPLQVQRRRWPSTPALSSLIKATWSKFIASNSALYPLSSLALFLSL